MKEMSIIVAVFLYALNTFLSNLMKWPVILESIVYNKITCNLEYLMNSPVVESI